jgi:hypothetical protein
MSIMSPYRQRTSRLRTLIICLVVALSSFGYLVRWSGSDRVTDTGVSIVAAVATTGAVWNAVSLCRRGET